jgi:hypothetical protein
MRLLQAFCIAAGLIGSALSWASRPDITVYLRSSFEAEQGAPPGVGQLASAAPNLDNTARPGSRGMADKGPAGRTVTRRRMH